jgi:hypothetical protein
MMLSWSTTFTITFAVLSSLVIADNPCQFDFPAKGIIDLSSLARTNGTAAYPDLIPTSPSGWSMLILFYLVTYYEITLNHRIQL